VSLLSKLGLVAGMFAGTAALAISAIVRRVKS